jgi:hypothetical protein
MYKRPTAASIISEYRTCARSANIVAKPAIPMATIVSVIRHAEGVLEARSGSTKLSGRKTGLRELSAGWFMILPFR